MLLDDSGICADLCNAAPSIVVHHMHDHVDGPSALLRDIMKWYAASRFPHGKLRQAPKCIRGTSWMDSPRDISLWDGDLPFSTSLYALELAHKRPHQRAHSFRLIVGS